jgi:hypothetical protein
MASTAVLQVTTSPAGLTDTASTAVLQVTTSPAGLTDTASTAVLLEQQFLATRTLPAPLPTAGAL